MGIGALFGLGTLREIQDEIQDYLKKTNALRKTATVSSKEGVASFNDAAKRIGESIGAATNWTVTIKEAVEEMDLVSRSSGLRTVDTIEKIADASLLAKSTIAGLSDEYSAFLGNAVKFGHLPTGQLKELGDAILLAGKDLEINANTVNDSISAIQKMAPIISMVNRGNKEANKASYMGLVAGSAYLERGGIRSGVVIENMLHALRDPGGREAANLAKLQINAGMIREAVAGGRESTERLMRLYVERVAAVGSHMPERVAREVYGVEDTNAAIWAKASGSLDNLAHQMAKFNADMDSGRGPGKPQEDVGDNFWNTWFKKKENQVKNKLDTDPTAQEIASLDVIKSIGLALLGFQAVKTAGSLAKWGWGRYAASQAAKMAAKQVAEEAVAEGAEGWIATASTGGRVAYAAEGAATAARSAGFVVTTAGEAATTGVAAAGEAAAGSAVTAAGTAGAEAGLAAAAGAAGVSLMAVLVPIAVAAAIAGGAYLLVTHYQDKWTKERDVAAAAVTVDSYRRMLAKYGDPTLGGRLSAENVKKLRGLYEAAEKAKAQGDTKQYELIMQALQASFYSLSEAMGDFRRQLEKDGRTDGRRPYESGLTDTQAATMRQGTTYTVKEITEAVESTAKNSDFSGALLKGLIQKESAFIRDRVNNKDSKDPQEWAYGLLQIKKRYFKDYGISDDNWKDPKAQLGAFEKQAKRYMSKYSEADWAEKLRAKDATLNPQDATILAWEAGETAVDNWLNQKAGLTNEVSAGLLKVYGFAGIKKQLRNGWDTASGMAMGPNGLEGPELTLDDIEMSPEAKKRFFGVDSTGTPIPMKDQEPPKPKEEEKPKIINNVEVHQDQVVKAVNELPKKIVEELKKPQISVLFSAGPYSTTNMYSSGLGGTWR
jgi:hypothetical protein